MAFSTTTCPSPLVARIQPHPSAAFDLPGCIEHLHLALPTGLLNVDAASVDEIAKLSTAESIPRCSRCGASVPPPRRKQPELVVGLLGAMMHFGMPAINAVGEQLWAAGEDYLLLSIRCTSCSARS